MKVGRWMVNKRTRMGGWANGRMGERRLAPDLPFSYSPTPPLSRSALPGPDDVLRTTLPNGITVLARENWSAPSIVLEGYLQVGNLDEPAHLPGLASYTTSLLSRGTQRRSFAEISETVEAVGASIGFGADRYTTSFSTKSLTEDLDLVLDVLSDELRHPVFPADHVEKVRGLRMTAIAERENDTRQMASLAFRELAYGDHPLGRNMLGTARRVVDPRREVYLLNVGRLSPEKGQTLLLRVVAALAPEYPGLRLAFAGTGPIEEDLKRLAAELGLASRVQFLGYVTDMPGLYAGADVVVQSSHTEGLPNVMLEASYLGVPIVATDVGGTQEVIEHGVSGWLVEPGSQAALEVGLRRFLRFPEQFIEMARNGRSYIEREFTFAARTEIQMQIYEKLR